MGSACMCVTCGSVSRKETTEQEKKTHRAPNLPNKSELFDSQHTHNTRKKEHTPQPHTWWFASCSSPLDPDVRSSSGSRAATTGRSSSRRPPDLPKPLVTLSSSALVSSESQLPLESHQMQPKLKVVELAESGAAAAATACASVADRCPSPPAAGEELSWSLKNL